MSDLRANAPSRRPLPAIVLAAAGLCSASPPTLSWAQDSGTLNGESAQTITIRAEAQ